MHRQELGNREKINIEEVLENKAGMLSRRMKLLSRMECTGDHRDAKCTQNLTVCVKVAFSSDILQTMLLHHLPIPPLLLVTNHTEGTAFLNICLFI